MRLHKRNSGFSLLELMISLSIGVVILLALGKVYQTANKTSVLSDELVDLNERIRAVSRVVESNITNAGYVDLMDCDGSSSGSCSLATGNGHRILDDAAAYRHDAESNDSPIGTIYPQAKPIYVCQYGFEDAIALDAAPACKTSGDQVDAFQFTFQATKGGALAQSSLQTADQYNAQFSGAGLDCQGRNIDTNNGFVTNRFFVDDHTLYCQSSVGGSKEPLLDNIEEARVFYRVLTNEKVADDMYKTVYLSPEDALNTADNPRGMAGVIGMRLCFVVTSPNKGRMLNVGEVQPAKLSCSGASTRAADDPKIYRKFELDYAMPNAWFAAN